MDRLQKLGFVALIMLFGSTTTLAGNPSEQGASVRHNNRSCYEFFRLATQAGEPPEELVSHLIFFDRQTWIAYVNDIEEWGYSVPVKDTRVLSAMHSMPLHLKNELLNIIGKKYRAAPRKWEGNDWLDPATGKGYLPPKRALDFWITELGDYRRSILQSVEKGKHPRVALNDYLASIQSALGTPTAEMYSADEVLQVARLLKTSLKKGHPVASDGYIVLGGSFPNGRARVPGSDIDLIISSPPLDRIMENEPEGVKSPVVAEGYSKMIKALNEEMARLQGSVSTLKFESKHDIFFTHEEHAKFFGGLQPISILVTKDAIKLRVHSSHGNGWVEGGDEIAEFLIE